ncbi:hypothetical protein CU633_00285 [Bacillus sp. V3-13]|nr:hypothetical protein CU633_00285 [Bacillus sp. V3-13]
MMKKISSGKFLIIVRRFGVQLQRLAPRVASVLPMKSKNDFTVRPSDVQDVLVPTLPQDVALLVGQRLSGLTKALPHFLLGGDSYVINSI